MSEFKGTKGPWHIDETGDIVSGPYNVCIPYATKPEDKVLMAAAPDLLEAAQYLREELNHGHEPSCKAVSKLSAAIAKALQP